MSSDPQPTGVIEIFYSYSHKDEGLREQLENHLVMLQRDGIIKGWHDRRISAGQEWSGKIDEHLNSADIILLLVSSDFLASPYCYDIEVKRAMERHEAGEAGVIPIILRPCDWQPAPFGKVQALPKDAKPATRWESQDEAFLDIAKGIRNAVKERTAQNRTETSTSTETETSTSIETVKPAPRLYIPRPPLIGFVARRDEQGRDIVERLREDLAPQQNQLITLSGPGGIGKTTLAAEAARALKYIFKGRLMWSSADGRTDFTLSTLLDDISTQLGHQELRTLAPDAKAAQVHALVAQPPALVVLDNYETISDDAKKRIEAWLTQAQCSALITSRHKINSTHNIPIAAMSPEEAQEFLEKLIVETQDAQIFSDSIRQQVYETAEANPYVMQWVVGQIDEAQEPDTVLEELQHGEGDAAQRVFDRSFNLPQLGDDGRAALLALSLFSPSASRPALAEIAGFGEDLKRINEAVKNLRALWLIKTIDEHRRFTIEGLTRSLAHARLSKDKHAAEFRQRFVAHFLSYAEAHEQPTPEDYDALEAEKDNVLGAMDAAFEMGDWSSVMLIAQVVTIPYGGMLSVRGYWEEAIRLSEQATLAAQNAKDEWRVAQFSSNAAGIRMQRGEYEEAKHTYQQALAISKKLESEAGVAVCLHQLGALAEAQGELNEARRFYNESLEINKRLGDQSGIASTLHQLAMIAQAQGELNEARRFYNESLEIKKRLGNQSGIASTLHQLAILAKDRGKVDEARRLYNESLEINRRLGDQRGIAITSYTIANLLFFQGELAEARRLYGESLAITEKLGDKSNLAIIFYNLGLLEEEEGNTTEAKRLWRETLSMFEQLGSPKAEIVRRELKRLEGEES